MVGITPAEQDEILIELSEEETKKNHILNWVNLALDHVDQKMQKCNIRQITDPISYIVHDLHNLRPRDEKIGGTEAINLGKKIIQDIKFLPQKAISEYGKKELSEDLKIALSDARAKLRIIIDFFESENTPALRSTYENMFIAISENWKVPENTSKNFTKINGFLKAISVRKKQQPATTLDSQPSDTPSL